MTLKELSLALGLLSSDNNPVPDAGGWQSFVWRVAPIKRCLSVDHRGFCVAVRDKWDWKRDQHYEFGYRENADGSVVVRLRLDNRDPKDNDNVCIVALFVDGSGHELSFIYQNWPSRHGRPIDREIPTLTPLRLANVKQVIVGTKQCKIKNPEDSRPFQALRHRLLSSR